MAVHQNLAGVNQTPKEVKQYPMKESMRTKAANLNSHGDTDRHIYIYMYIHTLLYAHAKTTPCQLCCTVAQQGKSAGVGGTETRDQEREEGRKRGFVSQEGGRYRGGKKEGKRDRVRESFREGRERERERKRERET